MSYLGNTPTDQSFVATVDYFNGDGSTVAFTLSRQVASIAQVQAVIENVPQNPSQAFSVLGNVITFTSAPPSGSANIYVYYTSPNTKVMAPSAGTVDTVALAAAAITSVKMANGGYEFGMRNRIINGDMKIDQRNAGASVTVAAGGAIYTVDRWGTVRATAGSYALQQSTTAPSGFYNSLYFYNNTAATPAAGDYNFAFQQIEGLNVADLGWGTASAQPVTLSFQVRASATGTYGGSLRNGAGNRSYPFTFVVNAVDTFETKTVTITGDTSGTWLKTNGVGIGLCFDLGSGASFRSTSGAWASGNYVGATGASQNMTLTSGATFYITGVQLEKGPVATPFEYRPYGTELALCQRYYYLVASGSTRAFAMGGYQTSAYIEGVVQFPMTMRATPALEATSGTNYYGIYSGNNADTFNSLQSEYLNVNGATVYNASEVSGTAGYAGWIFTNNASAKLAFTSEL